MINKMGLENDIAYVLYTEEQIKARVKELGEQISRDYAGKNPLLVCILRGASVFFTDLARCITDYMEMVFMAVSSYNDGMTSHGIVRIKKDLDVSIEGRHVIIVEDIMDSGNTLDNLTRLLGTRNPASMRIACLLDKPERRAPGIGISPEYCGFTVPNEFVVGYGLDYADAYRNLPFIGVLKPEVYSNVGE